MPAAKKKPAPRRKPVRDEDEQPAAPPFVPHKHQQEALDAFNAGKRYQYHAWHRRAGKDWFGMELASIQGKKEVGSYWHLLPKQVQARRAIWTGIDHITGLRFIERFFGDAIAVNNTEMFIEREGGSTWQLLGSDNYDRMVGSNPRGVVFSEWALCDPRAWDYIRPILRANGGWAIFISTFRGRNHAYQMWQNLQGNPEWFTSLKTVRDTGIVSEQDIQADRETGMSERMIRQEYYCQPAPPASLGTYARVFDALEQFGSVRALPESARENATLRLSLGVADDYVALLECAVRGSQLYISGGKIERNVTEHEILSGYLQSLSQGNATLAAPEDNAANILHGLRLAKPIIRKATSIETASFLERAIISPTSVLTAALTGGIDVMLDEEADPEKATAAVYDAVERLAGIARQHVSWGPAPDYTAHDKAVICHA